jgi:hypothetical protein
MSRSSSRGNKQEPTQATPDLAKFERLLQQTPEATPDRVCGEIARLLRVQHTEVALLHAEKDVLKFLFPAELRAAGSIPMSSSAVAARTAVTKTSVLSNTFIKVKHASLFETVKLNPSETNPQEPAPIQKLMSVPVHNGEGKILGVIQISRKGFDQAAVGPDFAMEDLRLLEGVATIVAKLEFMQLSSAAAK